MPSTTQIVPEHEYAHVMTVIHDNSARPNDDLGIAETTYANMMFVFTSPKGIDRELYSVSGGEKEFVERYGVGTFDDYGQPFLNAYAAARTNAATLHCLRVTADNATFAVGALVAHYKVSGTPTVDPDPVPPASTSESVNTMGHENVVVNETIDELTGTIDLTIAGVDVEPGISPENQSLFGDVSGEYIDVVIDLSKIIALDPTKNYQVTQINPALAEYIGKDENVSLVNGSYTKVKVYTGEQLADGLAILVGSSDQITIQVVEVVEADKVAAYKAALAAARTLTITPAITNTTDLGVQIADKEASYRVTQTDIKYAVTCSGEVVAGIINTNLYGTPVGNNVEVVLTFPNLDAEKTYKVVQNNRNLEQFASDPSVMYEVSGNWKKEKLYSGADLKGGYGLLLGEGKGNADVLLYEYTPGSTEISYKQVRTLKVKNELDIKPENSDSLSVKLMDGDGQYKIEKLNSTDWEVTLKGEVVMETVPEHADWWKPHEKGDLSEVIFNLPGLAAKKYYIKQENPALTTLWPQTFTENVKIGGPYTKAELDEEGYSVLATKDHPGDIIVTVYEAKDEDEGTKTKEELEGYTVVSKITLKTGDADFVDFCFDSDDPFYVLGDKHAGYAMENGNLVVTGSCAGGVINPTLWGDKTANSVELMVKIVGLKAEKSYRITQTNPNLQMFTGDDTISNVNGTWTKVKTYLGADIADGYCVLLGNGNKDGSADVSITVEEVVETKIEPVEKLVTDVTITNGYTFVERHIPPYVGPVDPLDPGFGVEPETPDVPPFVGSNDPLDPGYTVDPENPAWVPLGDPVSVNITAALSFTTTKLKSVMLRASAAARKVISLANAKAVALAAEEEGGAEEPRMDIYYTFEAADGAFTDYDNLGNVIQVNGTPDDNGYRSVKVFEICARGRGVWGNNVRFVLDSYARGDRLSQYKNYTLSIYEIDQATMTKKEEFTIALTPEAINTDGNTLYADYIVGDPYDNSSYVHFVTNPQALAELYTAYISVVPDTPLTKNQFDPLIGRTFGTTGQYLPNLYIDTTSNGAISLSGASGIALMGGSDGDFAIDNPNREAAINAAYLKAYAGEIDRNVRSKKMFPTDIILDANFPVEVKQAIHELVVERQDCVGIYDLGVNANTFAGLMEELADVEVFVSSRSESIEGYHGKIQDPVSFKIIKVSSTYALASMYPLHFQQHGAKHVPLAGSSYGVMSGFLSGTAWPVYDDDLDSDIMDTLTDSKVNYLKVNTKKQVVRGAQTTRQEADTNLSELSNVFVLHDIRRDAVQLCEQYEYNFAEASDLQRFNKAAAILAEKYRDAQVKSISATFDMNDWESERGILHLYIDFVHKNIIKRSIVEINVNRGTVDET